MGFSTWLEMSRFTELPDFIQWFSGSKVIDRNGEPLMVFHATKEQFTEFRPKSYGTWGDHSYFYFAASEAWSRKFAKEEFYADDPNVIKAYLRILAPLDLTGQAVPAKMWPGVLKRRSIATPEWLNTKIANTEHKVPIPAWALLRYDNGALQAEIIKAGYDGIKMSDVVRGNMDNTTWVAFEKSQIKIVPRK